MARARNIKPGLFKNELLVEQSLFVRLLFIGLWTLADREGRLEDRPKRIKLELFPYDDEDTDSALTVLVDNGFIVRYQAAGFNVIQIVNFLKHQTPHGTEKDSLLPSADGEFNVNLRNKFGYVTGTKRNNNVKPEENNVHLPGNNECTPVSERPDSPNHDSLITTTNVVGKEKKKRKVSSVLGEDFYPDTTGIALAEQLGVSIPAELPKFFDHHNGIGNVRADWQACWRTWVRNSVAFAQKHNPPRPINGRQAAISNYAIQAAEARAKNEFSSIERDITGEAIRVA